MRSWGERRVRSRSPRGKDTWYDDRGGGKSYGKRKGGDYNDSGSWKGSGKGKGRDDRQGDRRGGWNNGNEKGSRKDGGSKGGKSEGRGGKGKRSRNEPEKTEEDLDSELNAYFGIEGPSKDAKKESKLDMELEAYMKDDKKGSKSKEPAVIVVGLRVKNFKTGRHGKVSEVQEGGKEFKVKFDDGDEHWRPIANFEAEDGRPLTTKSGEGAKSGDKEDKEDAKKE